MRAGKNLFAGRMKNYMRKTENIGAVKPLLYYNVSVCFFQALFSPPLFRGAGAFDKINAIGYYNGMKCFILIASKAGAAFRRSIISAIASSAADEAGRRPMVICADSGARLVFPEIVPDLLVGDFDSIAPGLLAGISKTGAKIIKHPRDKDFTDFHLALESAFASRPAPSEITVFGGLAGRLDQTMANIYTAACYSSERSTRISLRDGKTSVYLLNRAIKKLRVSSGIRPGDTVSLRPLFRAARVKSVSGLKYPLANETLRAVETRGISNQAVADDFSIELSAGELVVVHISGRAG